jgi:hypothetical protein
VEVTRDLGAIGDSPLSVPPKVLEAVGRHFGVPDRVLNVLVPEVVLQGPRVMAIVRELEPTGMAKHVWVDREWHLGSLADAARVYAKTLPKCRLESAMNSMLAHRKIAVCDKSC